MAATARWWEDDLSYLVSWVAVTGFVLRYRWHGGNRGLRAVAGTLCVAGLMGSWYAGYQQQQPGGMYVPLAQDVATLTWLVSGVTYAVARLRTDRAGAASDAETTAHEGATPPEES